MKAIASHLVPYHHILPKAVCENCLGGKAKVTNIMVRGPMHMCIPSFAGIWILESCVYWCASETSGLQTLPEMLACHEELDHL